MSDVMASEGPQPLYLLFDSREQEKLAKVWEQPLALRALAWAEREAIPAGARVLTCLGDEPLRELRELAAQRQWQVGVLPHPEAPHAMRALGVTGSLEECVEHYRKQPAVVRDVMTCDSELVFGSVVIGKVLGLRPENINRAPGRSSFIRGVLRGISKLRLHRFQITTGKEQSRSVSALGLLALGHGSNYFLGSAVADELSIRGGRLTVLVLAPRSVLSYLWCMFRLLLSQRLTLSNLPAAVGVIQSDRVQISSEAGMEALLDGKPVHAGEVELTLPEPPLQLLPGQRPSVAPSTVAPDRDLVRLEHLPRDDTAKQLENKPLPLFSHASESEYRDLFRVLRDNASPTTTFQVLTILSALLALAGLYADSTPVIIGAMILAPLMAPLVSLAMGLARTNVALIRSAMGTLLVGIAWALACAVLMAWSLPLDSVTREMQARMFPDLLDLAVAVFSGVAGAYAHAREDIAQSLAGVAIAVALVPPLGVAGIGLGWADWDMARGAMLLFITNLVGITLAASMTFLVLGFAPLKLARKGVSVSLIMLAMICIPLHIAFQDLVERERIEEAMPAGVVELAGDPVMVEVLAVKSGRPHRVQVLLSADRTLDASHVDALKVRLVSATGVPLQVEAQFSLRR